MPAIQTRKKLSMLIAAAAAVGATGYLLFANSSPEQALQNYAEEYVEIAMALDTLHNGEVDIYFGPKALDNREKISNKTLEQLIQDSEQLITAIVSLELESPLARQASLENKVVALKAVMESLQEDSTLSYAEQANNLFGIDLSDIDSIDVNAYREELEEMLPGSGAIAYRLAQFRNQYIVPADKREAVVARALEECESLAQAHWSFPENEMMTVEWTQDIAEPWHEFKGNAQSLLRMNPMGMGYLSSAIDVACHEGYAGHHAQYVFVEQANGKNPLPEDTLVLLRSPESSLREGAANYAVGLAFPTQQRIQFEQEVLAPIAGLQRLDFVKYNRVRELLDEISLATVAILRDYNDRTIPPASATFRLEREALVSSPNQLLAFSDRFGAYAAAYTIAKVRIAAYVERQVEETGRSPWQVLKTIIEENQTAVLNYVSTES